jgi:hypothetical protein
MSESGFSEEKIIRFEYRRFRKGFWWLADRTDNGEITAAFKKVEGKKASVCPLFIDLPSEPQQVLSRLLNALAKSGLMAAMVYGKYDLDKRSGATCRYRVEVIVKKRQSRINC